MQSDESKRSRQDNRCCENSRLRGYGYHNKENHHSEDEGVAEYSQDIRAGSHATRSAPNKKQWDHTRPNQDVSYKHARQAVSLYQTAGLEAARVCAERGYAVTLYEEDGILGGLLPFANAVKGPHENIQQFLDYLTNMLDIEGVTVETGVTADLATVQAANPDVVIVATGGKRPALYAEGTEKTPVISIDDFYGAELGENVTILGFNAQAMDTAWYLLAQGKNVAIVSNEPEDSLAKGQSYKMRVFTLPALYALGCRVWPNATLKTVSDGEVTITGDVGIDISFACDCVIDARDMEKNLDLFDEIEAAGYTAYAVGDCYDPWDIQSAVAYGNLAARKC